MFPQIYLGQTPTTAHGRRALRLRALDLFARFSQPADAAPTVMLLHALPEGAGAPVDLLLLRPNATLVGVIKECDGPIEVRPNGQWIARATGAPVRGPQGETPLEQIRRSRELMLRQVARITDARPDLSELGERLGATVGALICAPSTHPETHVVMDVEDHRQRIKFLGLDELFPLASMLQAGAQLDAALMRSLAADVFGGRLWHNGERLLFELGWAPHHLRVLGPGGKTERLLPLLEGANVVGRRATPVQHEYRLTLGGDDSMSNDHAIIVCGADGRVLLRDTSTNGTWLLAPGQPEQRVHHNERPLPTGSVLRMGETRLVLEST